MSRVMLPAPRSSRGAAATYSASVREDRSAAGLQACSETRAPPKLALVLLFLASAVMPVAARTAGLTAPETILPARMGVAGHQLTLQMPAASLPAPQMCWVEPSGHGLRVSATHALTARGTPGLPVQALAAGLTAPLSSAEQLNDELHAATKVLDAADGRMPAPPALLAHLALPTLEQTVRKQPVLEQTILAALLLSTTGPRRLLAAAIALPLAAAVNSAEVLESSSRPDNAAAAAAVDTRASFR